MDERRYAASSSLPGTLTGKVIVVTGASSGVGYAVTRRLALTEGATVAAVGRRRMFRVEALARQIASQSGEERLLPITADMATAGQAQALAAQVVTQFGRIDGFVHAVNRVLKLTALEVSDGEFDMTMQVNVKSALQGVQALAPTLRRQEGGGAIVIYNPTPLPTPMFAASEAVYAAAAHALSALAGGWRRQLGPAGIQVCEVAPMPLTDPPASDLCSHDDLILDALRDAFAPRVALSAPIGDARNADGHKAPQADDAPIVLTRLGGLSLTQFSKA